MGTLSPPACMQQLSLYSSRYNNSRICHGFYIPIFYNKFKACLVKLSLLLILSKSDSLAEVIFLAESDSLWIFQLNFKDNVILHGKWTKKS
jgi:hypothetical protein